MRRITVAVAGTLAAALASGAWGAAAGPALATSRSREVLAGSPASPATCYAFALSALRRREVVRHRPAACAGLRAQQVNQAVGRAIHTVVGPLPKAAARRKALAESRYLASLIRPVRPPRPASLAAGTTGTPSTLAGQLAALAAWLAAALAGAYLLAGRLRRAGRRPLRALGVAGGHAGLALAGLCLWVAYMVTAAPALGWIDVALTWVIVGLGMATLLVAPPRDPTATAQARGTGPLHPAAAGSDAAPAAAWPARAPVLVIALHGVLATTTILLVLLAVIGAG
jgi:hypothetical protein